MKNSTLCAYRTEMYACFLRAGDALMNLNDALLTDTAAHSFVELTLSPFFEREWPSAYAACKDGVINREELRKLRVHYAPMPTQGTRLVLAGDASSIARPASATARDRTYVHQSNSEADIWSPPVSLLNRSFAFYHEGIVLSRELKIIIFRMLSSFRRGWGWPRR